MRPNNLTFPSAACIVVPAAMLAAAHWFPWRRLLRRDLTRLEAYGIGTAAIVGTAAAAISESDGDGYDHALMLLLAAASAGGTTLLAHLIDYVFMLRAELAQGIAEQDFLHEYTDR